MAGTATATMTTTLSSSSSLLAIGVALLAAASFFVAPSSAGPVPAVYVFGDSLADVGNNNHLLTLLKANFPHNGIDYPGKKSTGRFSNGKNFPDFLGARVQYSFFIIIISNANCMSARVVPSSLRQIIKTCFLQPRTWAW
jgi:hypothetical protein